MARLLLHASSLLHTPKCGHHDREPRSIYKISFVYSTTREYVTLQANRVLKNNDLHRSSIASTNMFEN
jgi:hypothetical protein